MAEGRTGYTVYVKDGASAALAKIKSAFSKQGGAADSATKSLLKWVGGMAAAYLSIQMIKSIVADGIKGMAFQIDLEDKLTAKYGEKAKALFANADAMQLVTKFGDEQTMGLQIQLSYFNLSVEAINKLTPALLDMAEAGMGIESSAMLIGRAMAGSITMLSRYGIVLTDVQKKTMAGNDEMAKAAVMVDVLNSKFGGLAKTGAESVRGSFIQLNNALGDLKENFWANALRSSDLRDALSGLAKIVLDMSGSGEGGLKNFTLVGLDVASAMLTAGEGVLVLAGAIKTMGSTSSATIKLLTAVSSAAVSLAKYDARGWYGQRVGDSEQNAAAMRQSSDDLDAAIKAWKASGSVDPEDTIFGKAAVSAMMANEKIKQLQESIKNTKSTLLKPDKRAGSLGGLLGGEPADGAAKGAEAAQEALRAQIEAEAAARDYRQEIERNFRNQEAIGTVTHFQQLAALEEIDALIRLDNIEEERLAREASNQQWIDAFTPSITSLADYMGNAFKMATAVFGRGLADAIVDGKADTQELAKSFLKNMIMVTAEMLMQMAILAAMKALMGGATGGAGGVFGGFLGLHSGGPIMHSGGPIRAHGGYLARRDEVPIIAQRGEFVLRREAVQSIGASNVARMNRTGRASGGGVQFSGPISITILESKSPRETARAVRDELLQMSYNGEGIIYSKGVVNG